MKYVKRTLADDEIVLEEAKFHWTYNFMSVVWLVLFGWIIIGIVMAIYRTVDEITTELVITNRRFVYKRGFIIRHTNEFALDRIESVVLRQGFLGRMLGFGDLVIRGSGIGEIELPTIGRPLEFRRSLINATRDAGAMTEAFTEDDVNDTLATAR
ncbi:MAG: PH domain-containing protein [Pseudomonadota bacterium]